ncbi:MAG: hypothetical protein JJ971_07415 [Balneolaceae bacterium]|nr:hypothetical protein [Balneolaceae bacterium]MBO6546938.1 hypothetical protein [Balneolaceae bacterium]MBO6649298.1 hypothetical protein [Balneolaceae bacterium]
MNNQETSNPIIGSWLCSGSSVIAELMAISGYDFLAIDVEHSPVDLEKSFGLLQAIKSGNRKCRALVRVSGNSYSENKRYLDAGADGIICPMINSKEEAQLLVDSVKYPPQGRRGVGFSRSNDYGLNLHASFNESNKSTFVCVQIEDINAIYNLDEILSVKGIDAALIGPYDLSTSMGITGDFSHPKMTKAIEDFLIICKRNKVLPGIHQVAPNPDLVKKRIKEGYKFIAYSVDITLVSSGSQKALEELRSQ